MKDHYKEPLQQIWQEYWNLIDTCRHLYSIQHSNPVGGGNAPCKLSANRR